MPVHRDDHPRYLLSCRPSELDFSMPHTASTRREEAPCCCEYHINRPWSNRWVSAIPVPFFGATKSYGAARYDTEHSAAPRKVLRHVSRLLGESATPLGPVPRPVVRRGQQLDRILRYEATGRTSEPSQSHNHSAHLDFPTTAKHTRHSTP